MSKCYISHWQFGAVLLFSCSGLTMTRGLKRQGWWITFNQPLQIGREPKILWQASKKFSSWDLLLFSINFEHEQSVWDEQDCYHGYSAALLYFLDHMYFEYFYICWRKFSENDCRKEANHLGASFAWLTQLDNWTKDDAFIIKIKGCPLSHFTDFNIVQKGGRGFNLIIKYTDFVKAFWHKIYKRLA